MTNVLAAIQVLVGAFVLFVLARFEYPILTQRHGWWWVGFVGVLALFNMLIYRVAGSTINPPVFTALLFGITVLGITPRNTRMKTEEQLMTYRRWTARGACAVAAGTAIGWTFFV